MTDFPRPEVQILIHCKSHIETKEEIKIADYPSGTSWLIVTQILDFTLKIRC